ncbi:hypothetical protein ACF05T_33815 [Streptomyces lateritius]|uniref:Uncharacterized protein n=1 Tax=Streptomyces lateritius TaxID=67313 RepID=A0ABW6YM82_9ACTN
MSLRVLRTALAAIVIAGSGLIVTTTPAQAAGACKTLSAPGGGSAYMCKSWNSVGGGYYNGSWWSQGPVPTKVYLKVIEDSWEHEAAFSGSYNHREFVQLKLCYTLTDRCGTPW